jgi:hypothetical protein
MAGPLRRIDGILWKTSFAAGEKSAAVGIAPIDQQG